MITNDVREDIIKILSKHPDGLTIQQIAETLKAHRHTISKYVFALNMAGIIDFREIGRAKLCFLSGKRTKGRKSWVAL